jgi:hypothetical protein
MQTIVTPGHDSAPATDAPSRDMGANFGVGTLRREDPNMLRSRQVAISLAGMTQPQWKQSRAVEFRGGVLPKSRAMDVTARSGNQDNLAAIGLDVEAETNVAQVGAGGPPLVKQALDGAQLAFMALAAWAGYKILFGKSQDD